MGHRFFTLLMGSFLIFSASGCDESSTNGSSCGDRVIDIGEDCDSDNLGGQDCMAMGYHGGALACNEDCQFVLTDCENAGYCGDGSIQSPNEVCDGENLGGATCLSLDRAGGTLACTDTCTFDTTGCIGDEVCDDGLDNDSDGLIDCLDPDCSSPPAEKQEGVCTNTTQVCNSDTGAWEEPDYSTIEGYQSVETHCDGLDNDCDGIADILCQEHASCADDEGASPVYCACDAGYIEPASTPPLCLHYDGICGDSFGDGHGVATDAAGYIYLTGTFSGTATWGSTTLTAAGSNDVFVVKLTPAREVLWAIRVGGTENDYANDIVADQAGNAFVTGAFLGTADFGTTPLTASGSAQDIFVMKVSPTGQVLWAQKAGSTYTDSGNNLAVDVSGNLYMTGAFSSTVDFGGNVVSCSGGLCAFVWKLSGDGVSLWAKGFGEAGDVEGFGVTVDVGGNAYVAGRFDTTTTFGTITLTNQGDTDIFVLKLDPDGTLLWALDFGGPGYEFAYGISVDSTGNLSVTGPFFGTVYFGAEILTSVGNNDIFVLRLDADGTPLWAKSAGGDGNEGAMDVAVDDLGNSYVTGYFANTAVFGGHSVTSNGSADTFVMKLDSAGNVSWVASIGGPMEDRPYRITIDPSGTIYVTGFFWGSMDLGDTTLTATGGRSAYLWGIFP